MVPIFRAKRFVFGGEGLDLFLGKMGRLKFEKVLLL